MKPHQIILINILIIFCLLMLVLLLKEPPVWPDEAIYADIANNLIKENRLGTDLWKGTIPGVEKNALWYPPLFFSLLVWWFKLFGLSIINQRLLSIIIGLGFVIVFYFFSKLLLKEEPIWYSVLPSASLIADFTFLKAGRVSRPEIVVLFFSVLAFWSLLKSFDSNKKKNLFFAASGLFSSFAVLSHFIAFFVPFSIISYLIISKKIKLFSLKKFYLFIFSFSLPIIIWLVFILSKLHILFGQISLAAQRKSLELPWVWLALHDQPFPVKVIYWLYLVFTLLFIFFSLIKKERRYLFLSLILFFSWSFSIYGKMFWYAVFPIPFIYLAGSILISRIIHRLLKSLILILFFLLIFINLKINTNLISTLAGDNYSYNRFTAAILKIIPKNKTVFLSSIPDPYYGFKTKRKNSKLYEFPVLKTKKENYLKILNDSDFIVYSGSHESLVFGDFLQKYIERNKLVVYSLEEPFQYQALVIKLKPKNQRIVP